MTERYGAVHLYRGIDGWVVWDYVTGLEDGRGSQDEIRRAVESRNVAASLANRCPVCRRQLHVANNFLMCNVHGERPRP